MRSVLRAGAKFFVLSFVIVIFMTLNQGVARADTVIINGVTVGSFNNPIFFSPTSTLFGLTFNGIGFPNPIGVADTSASSFTLFLGPDILLGSFTLTGEPATYTGNTFALQLNFPFSNGPQLSVTGSSQPFTASLIGTVQSSSEANLVKIDFNNAPSVFTVTLDGIAISSFSIVLRDIFITPGETVNIIGTISQTSTVPEQATLVMLSTGLAGLGAAIRKRRKAG